MEYLSFCRWLESLDYSWGIRREGGHLLERLNMFYVSDWAIGKEGHFGVVHGMTLSDHASVILTLDSTGQSLVPWSCKILDSIYTREEVHSCLISLWDKEWDALWGHDRAGSVDIDRDHPYLSRDGFTSLARVVGEGERFGKSGGITRPQPCGLEHVAMALRGFLPYLYEIRQWHPITLPTAYKVLAKMINACVRSLLPDFIHNTQTSFV